MRLRWLKHILYIVPILLLCSCQDDFFDAKTDVKEGERATIYVNVAMPDMNILTRSAGIDPDGEEARTIEDLWVAVYNSNSGARTGMKYLAEDEFGDNGLLFQNHVFKEIEIEALSGPSYIVAVANCSGKEAVDVSSPTVTNLKSLLDRADTWEAYKKIAYTMEDQETIYRFGILTMSGFYIDSDHPETIKNNFIDNFVAQSDNPKTPVTLSGGNNVLEGAIHLRRLSSHYHVNVIPNQLVSFTPTSWQLSNLPAVAFINERHDASASALVNAADKSLNIFDGHNYHDSYEFPASSFDFDKGNGRYSFEFFQLENKHTGLPSCQRYEDRELEFKNGNLNTGWYSSLVSAPGDIPATPVYDDSQSNNNASFITLKGKMEYYYRSGDPQYTPVDPSTPGSLVKRYADVSYVVHLGYCEGDGEAKARDFNARRNTKYTYNLYIDGADKIRVEAIKDTDDPQPGAEGVVTDIIDNVFELDCHYGVVNIYLPDDQREGLVWRTETPFGDNVIDLINGPSDRLVNLSPDMTNLSLPANSDKLAAIEDNQFYNWIQFRPTTGPDVIATYPGDPRLKERNIRNNNDEQHNQLQYYPTGDIKTDKKNGAVWFLEQLRDPVNYPNPSGWFTVYIDEYVYEYDYNVNLPRMTGSNTSTWRDDRMDLSKWRNFVNRPNRSAWLMHDNMYVSNDEESIYSNAVVLFTQESIQTYYGDSAPEALGIEATNESYIGAALSYTRRTPINHNDGRVNQYNFVNIWDWGGKDWTTAINRGNERFRQGKKHVHGVESNQTYYIPNHTNDYLYACIARNRDLNNNGLIEVNEIRWYLPTDAVYTRIVLGSPSLRSPLFNLKEYTPDEIQGGIGAIYSHYAGSNFRMTWAEEFTATGELNVGGVQPAGTLRCVRNMGQKPEANPGVRYNTDEDYHSVEPAYKKEGHLITLNYYRPETLRSYYDGFFKIHDVSSIFHLASSKFRYAQNNCTPTNCPGYRRDLFDFSDYNSGAIPNMNSNYTVSNNWRQSVDVNGICGRYAENADGSDRGTWRLPTITELSIMTLLSTTNPNQNDEDLRTRGHASCSTEYFNRIGILGAHQCMGTIWIGDGQTYPNISADPREGIFIRCVKDIR